MGDFNWRHHRSEIILWAVRWYRRYGVSYRNLEEMLCERGVDVDHTTIDRWVQCYAPEIEKRLRWSWNRPSIARSWRVDETYVKVSGKWACLYRETPLKINTDQAPADGVAIRELAAEGTCLADTLHRQVKYLNNVVEADHGKLKRLIRPTLGFKSMKTASATLKGFEVMHALRKGQAALWQYGGGIMGEVRLIERNFGVYTASRPARDHPLSADGDLCNRGLAANYLTTALVAASLTHWCN